MACRQSIPSSLHGSKEHGASFNRRRRRRRRWRITRQEEKMGSLRETMLPNRVTRSVIVLDWILPLFLFPFPSFFSPLLTSFHFILSVQYRVLKKKGKKRWCWIILLSCSTTNEMEMVERPVLCGFPLYVLPTTLSLIDLFSE